MKRLIALLLALLMLTGCGAKTEAPAAPQETEAVEVTVPAEHEITEIPYESRFSSETLIELSDAGIKTSAMKIRMSMKAAILTARVPMPTSTPLMKQRRILSSTSPNPVPTVLRAN